MNDFKSLDLNFTNKFKVEKHQQLGDLSVNYM